MAMVWAKYSLVRGLGSRGISGLNIVQYSFEVLFEVYDAFAVWEYGNRILALGPSPCDLLSDS